MSARDRDPDGSRMPTAVTRAVAAIDWPRVAAELDAQGWAVFPRLLDAATECERDRRRSTSDGGRFRSRVVMARHGFGRGEYKYFAYPLPDLVAALREALYPHLAPIANRWNEAMGIGVRYPGDARRLPRALPRAGQTRPTPLLLQYGAGDYNCLHQDLYGEHVFPLQVAILLSEPGADFTGGEFVLTEQRPRMQSRPSGVPLRQGDAVVFAVHQRPVQGTRGIYRVNLRHGVSRVRSGPSAHARASSSTTPPEPPVRDDARAVRRQPAPRRRASRSAHGAMLLRGFAAAVERPRCWPHLQRRARGGAVPPHGDAGRLSHVGGDDQLRRAGLGQRPQRLPLRSRSIPRPAGAGRRCRPSFADLASDAPRRRQGSTASCPTPASSTVTSPARGCRCTRTGTSATSARRSSRCRSACRRCSSSAG